MFFGVVSIKMGDQFLILEKKINVLNLSIPFKYLPLNILSPSFLHRICGRAHRYHLKKLLCQQVVYSCAIIINSNIMENTTIIITTTTTIINNNCSRIMNQVLDYHRHPLQWIDHQRILYQWIVVIYGI